MCGSQKITLPDGTQVDSGYIDCMSPTCNNSIKYNPPPQPDPKPDTND